MLIPLDIAVVEGSELTVIGIVAEFKSTQVVVGSVTAILYIVLFIADKLGLNVTELPKLLDKYVEGVHSKVQPGHEAIVAVRVVEFKSQIVTGFVVVKKFEIGVIVICPPELPTPSLHLYST